MRKGLPCLVLSIVAALAAAPNAAVAAEDPALATVYDPATVGVIDLTLSSEAIAALEAEPDEDVKGTFSYAITDGTPGGSETVLTSPNPTKVEVHLKGSVGGSFRPITGKAAFKLKFKAAETFLGLRKMTLNNMVQDDSMIHEALAYSTFAAAGVPSSRSGYAYVRLNGEDLGLYANVETLDKVALEKHFGPFQKPPQHLYEGEKGHDVTVGGAAAFEVDEGEDADLSDLEALIAAANGAGEEPWSTRVEPYLDLTEMTRMWAVEKYIDHWDGYSGHALAGLRPHNYYLYSDASGRFQMLPWGADQTYIPTIGVGTPGREVLFDGEGGLLFDLCLEDEACARLYWEALDEVTAVVADLDPGTLAADTAALLAPWEQLEREEGRPQFTAEQVEEGVDVSRDFIAGRDAEARAWLDANQPPPPTEEPGGGIVITPGVIVTETLREPLPTLDSPAAKPEQTPVVAPKRIVELGVQKGDGVVRLRLRAGVAGTATLVGRSPLDGKLRNVCRDQVSVSLPRDFTVVCRVSARGRQRLRRDELPIFLRLRFAADDAGETILNRRATLPRQ